MPRDPSNGYNEIAEEFMRARSNSGAEVARSWAKSLPRGASVLDIGAGNGVPITQALVEAGLNVSAIDASPIMVAAFRENFLDIEIACEPVQTSTFFDQKFDGILAVGLIFLLTEEDQRDLITKAAKALNPGGQFLFSAPKEIGEWEDVLTGLTSHSLGEAEYYRLLKANGFGKIETREDEGGSNYFLATVT